MGFKRYVGEKAAWKLLSHDGNKVSWNIDLDVATTDYRIGIKFNADEIEGFWNQPNLRIDFIWLTIHWSWFRG